MTEHKLLTIEETAAVCDVEPNTVRHWIDQRRMPATSRNREIVVPDDAPDVAESLNSG